jgi:hypothetical protein
VEYEADGQRASTELNAYLVKKLPAIVAAICAKKGFDNPVEPPGDGDTDHS